MEMDGQIVSDGTVNFSYPKYFCYENPQLSCEITGDEITITAQAYAKSVEIRKMKRIIWCFRITSLT